MNRWKYLAAMLALVALALAATLGARWRMRQQWFELQRQQLATIGRLREFPPAGWDRGAWENAVGTLHNVWGNVTYAPSYSRITADDMQSQLRQLERIVAATSSETSVESVDRVFQLLQQRGDKVEFISAYRDEFRAYANPTIPSAQLEER